MVSLAYMWGRKKVYAARKVVVGEETEVSFVPWVQYLSYSPGILIKAFFRSLNLFWLFSHLNFRSFQFFDFVSK